MPRQLTKTATDKTFAGRRIALTNMALIAIAHDNGTETQLRYETAVCSGIDENDNPIWQSLTDPIAEPYEGLSFVSRESNLHVNTWTFKERV